MVCLVFSVGDAIIEPLQLPEQRADTSTFQTVQSILMQYRCRIVYLIKADGDVGGIYELTAKFVGQMRISSVNLEANKVGLFNGPYATFSYTYTLDQSSMYLVFIAKVEDILTVLPKVRDINLFRARHKIVFVSNLKDNETVDLNQVERIFRACFAKEIINVVLLARNEEIYTYFPFTNEFTVRINGSLFPDKLEDMNGYLLRGSAFLASWDAMISSTDGTRLGRDIFLWQTVIEALNARFTYVESTDGITYGLKFPNGTMTGVFADVAQNVTDLAINSRMVKLQFENVLEGTYPHDRDDVAILVPCARNVPDYYKFSMLFSKQLWLLIIILAVMFGIAWWRVVTPGRPGYAAMEALSATLGRPVNKPIGGKERLLLLMYTSYTFFLLAAYEGTLTSVLTVPIKAAEINTLEQLVKSKLPIYAATRFKDMFLQNVDARITKRLIPVPDDPDIEEIVRKNGHYAVVQKESFAYKSIYSRRNYREDGSPIYRIMRERPMPSQVCYAARYGSALIPRINRLLRRFGESGLNEYWKWTTIHRFILDEKLGEVPAPVSLQVLTFSNISLAFAVLTLGLAAATVAVLCELAVNHWKRVL